MTVRRLLQIVPVLPPAPQGIAGYAQTLADELAASHGIQSTFLSCAPGPTETGGGSGGWGSSGVVGRQLDALDASHLLHSIPAGVDAVLVHFDFEVAPLYDALRQAKLGALRNTRIVVMFHEIHPLWEMPARRRLKLQVQRFHPRQPGPFGAARRFAQLADAVVTNTRAFHEVLTRWTGGQVDLLPCFSNLGEPISVSPLVDRAPRLVVFGSPGTRERLFGSIDASALARVVSAFGIDEIHEIGEPHGGVAPDLPGVTWVRPGVLSTADVSRLMLDARAGLLDYSHHPGTLGKSGVLAAYASHGVVTVSPTGLASEDDGLVSGRHYLQMDRAVPERPEDRQAVADAGRAWYLPHGLHATSSRFAAVLGG